MFRKNFITSFLIFSIIISSIFPLFTKKAEAQWVVIDPAHTAVTSAEAGRRSVLDGLNFAARAAATLAIEAIVNSTITWAQSGFDGNPAYATNPGRFFGRIADGAAGEFILGSDLGFLCSPFQANIRLSLAHQYVQPQRFQCTLSQVVGNIEDFYSDFNVGGWDAWFTMTQHPANNPYGAYLEAKIEMDSRVASALGIQREQLNWNQGFLSWEGECLEENPPQWIDRPGDAGTIPSRVLNPRHNPGMAVGECIRRGDVKTPGSTIKSQLDRVLPASMDRLINAQSIDNLIAAFATGILRRYVFGRDGLFSTTGEAVPGVQATSFPAGGGGGGACMHLMSPDATASVMHREVELAMEAVAAESYFQTLYADDDGIREFKEAVRSLLSARGHDVSNGWNGNCNSSANNLGIRVGNSDVAEMYEIARVGAMCGGDSIGTIPEHISCRPFGYVSTWAYQSTGNPQSGGGAPPTAPPPGGGGTPPPTTPPPPGGPQNESATVNAVASGSTEWGNCQAGDAVSCHRFVREVASTLAAQNSRWGLLTKGPGEMQCTMTECGTHLGGAGYGEDVVVYRIGESATSNLYIVDIIAGAGAPGASLSWQVQPHRAGNNWAPVP